MGRTGPPRVTVPAMSSAISGEQFVLTAGPYEAVVTELGAGLRTLTWQDEPLVLAYDADEPAPAAFGQLLIPWPNRIDHGRYPWDGQELQLDISEPQYDCAIHGLVRWLTWHPVEHQADRVRMICRLLGSPGYPFRLALEADYTLSADEGLTIRLTAVNEGAHLAPYAHGAHPYLCVGQPIDQCRVQLPAARHLPVDERMIPRGPAEPVDGTDFDFRKERLLGDLQIDRAFTELERDADGRAWTHLFGDDRTASLWIDDAHPWLEIYTADGVPPEQLRHGLGVEPMTTPPNGFASSTDVVTLAPGATFTGSWGIQSSD